MPEIIPPGWFHTIISIIAPLSGAYTFWPRPYARNNGVTGTRGWHRGCNVETVWKTVAVSSGVQLLGNVTVSLCSRSYRCLNAITGRRSFPDVD